MKKGFFFIYFLFKNIKRPIDINGHDLSDIIHNSTVFFVKLK